VIRPVEGGRRDMPPHRDARVAMMSIGSTVECHRSRRAGVRMDNELPPIATLQRQKADNNDGAIAVGHHRSQTSETESARWTPTGGLRRRIAMSDPLSGVRRGDGMHRPASSFDGRTRRYGGRWCASHQPPTRRDRQRLQLMRHTMPWSASASACMQHE
jgi:hypothetical protein